MQEPASPSPPIAPVARIDGARSRPRTSSRPRHLEAHAVAPGATVSVAHRLFAGAKVVQLLQTYEDKDGIARFHMAVDWGWFWFFTQPIFFLLDNTKRLE